MQKELKNLELRKFIGVIMFIMYEVFSMPASRHIFPPNEKYGKFVQNEVLEVGNFGVHDERNSSSGSHSCDIIFKGCIGI